MIKVGHRGARAYEPENTLLSFKKAIELGVDAVELDVRRTKDNEIVVIHDADLKRTTNGEGLVIIVSFLEDALKRVRELDAQIETGLIYAKHKNPLRAAFELKAQWLLSFYRFTHTADVEKAHAKGLKVLTWTVNTSEEMTEMAKKGVDAIASDKPDILVAVEAGKGNGAKT